MKARLIAAFAGVAAVSLAIVSAQTRDQGNTAAANAGTGRIAGVVVESGTSPTPVRRVIVTLTAAELPAGRTAITDDDGRFVFDRLPAGRFSLSATKPAYLTASYGSPKPGRPGIPLQLDAGQRMDNLQLVVARGAVLTGALHDPNGEPLANLSVHAFKVPPAGASQLLALTGSGTTDDRGVYRIFGLPPGEYVIASAVRVAAGAANDVSVLRSEQIDRALRDLQIRGAAAPTSAVPVAPSSPATTMSYAPVFYPGTTLTSEATRVTVGLGEERRDLDFIVRLTRMATMRGSVTAADGRVPAAQFVIRFDGLQLPSLIGSVPTFSTAAGPSGRTFTYTNVAPGRYLIYARSSAPMLSFALAAVDVRGDDVEGLSLVLQPAAHLTGRIVFAGATASRPSPEAASLILRATNGLGNATQNTTNLGNFGAPAAVVSADGQFEVGGIPPDTFRLSATLPGAPGWWLRSAISNGRDLLDYPLVVGGTDVTGVVLTFSDRHTTFSGRIEKGTGEPAAAYFIAILPSDRTMWMPGARRIQLVRAAGDGTWIAKDLPPGDYRLAALTEIDSSDLMDVRVLDAIAAASIKITLGEGENKTQNLRVGGSLAELTNWRIER